METLRTLSLLKVKSMIREGLQDTEIPKGIAEDLKMCQLFNGTFLKVTQAHFTTKKKMISIYYNGVSWTFSVKSVTYASYDLKNPIKVRMSRFEIKEHTTVEAYTPMFNIKRQIDVLHGATDGSKPLPPSHLIMRVKVKVTDDGKTGRILFYGPNFQFIWRVNQDRFGKRVLSHHAVIKIEAENENFDYMLPSIRLEETNDEEIKGNWKGKDKQLAEVEFDPDHDEEMEYNMFTNPEMFQIWELIDEGGLEDFWGVVES